MNIQCDDITAKRIVLLDKKGRIRVRIEAESSEGTPEIEMYGKKDRLLIRESPEGNIFIAIDSPPRIGVVAISTQGVFLDPNLYRHAMERASDSKPNKSRKAKKRPGS